MKTLRHFLLLAALVLAAPLFAAEPVPLDKDTEAEIRRMIRLTGMEQLVDQMMGQMLGTFEQNAPDVPAEFWKGVREEMRSEELIEALLPVYAKYYTKEDLRAINDFYETPAGQRLIKQMPLAMQEAMVIGQKWGEQTAQRVIQKIEAERASHKAAPEPAKPAN